MRTTLTLDDDVATLIRTERAGTGESLRDVVNRLIRSGTRPNRQEHLPSLPVLPGEPILDVADVSALLAAHDDERRAERGVI